MGKMKVFQQFSQQMHIFKHFRFQRILVNKQKLGFAFIFKTVPFYYFNEHYDFA